MEYKTDPKEKDRMIEGARLVSSLIVLAFLQNCLSNCTGDVRRPLAVLGWDNLGSWKIGGEVGDHAPCARVCLRATGDNSAPDQDRRSLITSTFYFHYAFVLLPSEFM